ncbi:P-loop containing nucleoside triphosphate hydrolase protein [Pisolithus marmoratus]|nr:P-loop containing nucleoside triphosphate hydrolase protein [Pisolithus marmoratus]
MSCPGNEVRIACVYTTVFTFYNRPDSPRLYSVMGVTGSGKSTFINCASESDLPVGKGLESCTFDVQTSKPFYLNKRMVTLIDTPGFDDTNRKERDVLTHISAYLANTYEQGVKLTGIIYMHRISDTRMTGTSRRNFSLFRELCGKDAFKNILIVTNMWRDDDLVVFNERERELATDDKYYKPMLDGGARMVRHNGTPASAKDIISQLINNGEVTLVSQREIVEEHKEFSGTAVGKELTRALEEQAEEYDTELQKLHAGLEASTRDKDEQKRQVAQDDLQKKREEIESIKSRIENMEQTFKDEKARLLAIIADMEAEKLTHMERIRDLEKQREEQAEKEKQERLLQKEEIERLVRRKERTEEEELRRERERRIGLEQARKSEAVEGSVRVHTGIWIFNALTAIMTIVLIIWS